MNQVGGHYEVLDVAPTASSDQVRAAYRKLARRFHPDNGLEPNPAVMAAVNSAWHTLSDPGRRAMYDASLRPPDHAEPPPVGHRSWVLDESPVPYRPDAGPRRWPALGLMIMAAMAVIFLFTAYATRSGELNHEEVPGPSGLGTGNCVVLRAGLVRPASCAAKNYGVVTTLIARDVPCPLHTEGYFEAATSNLVCVTPR